MRVAVLQSFRTTDVPHWIAQCMASVRAWATSQEWDYFALDDRFLELPPAWARERCGRNIYAVTDLARLIWASEVLSGEYARVIWLDADVLVFEPKSLTDYVGAIQGHGFARELFLQVSEGRTESKWGINNSLMVFDKDDCILSEYLRCSFEKIRRCDVGKVPRTALGPDLLEKISFSLDLKKIEGVGLFTPALLEPFATGNNSLMYQYLSYCSVPPAAANLCHFMRNATPVSRRHAFDTIYTLAVMRLLRERLVLDTPVG